MYTPVRENVIEPVICEFSRAFRLLRRGQALEIDRNKIDQIVDCIEDVVRDRISKLKSNRILTKTEDLPLVFDVVSLRTYWTSSPVFIGEFSINAPIST